jgi:hypothetical protein
MRCDIEHFIVLTLVVSVNAGNDFAVEWHSEHLLFVIGLNAHHVAAHLERYAIGRSKKLDNLSQQY